jgi:Methyltransferase domain
MIPDVFSTPYVAWQMTSGERAAYEGALSFVRPRLAVEVGSAAGGSLERTAAHSEHVHSFDMAEPGPAVRALPNVTFHRGDSHKLLAAWLETVVSDGATVDFAHVDGDHSSVGVAQDITDLLSCPAFDGVMLLHDVANQDVRDGLDLVGFERFPDVVYVDYDFVPGRMQRRRNGVSGSVEGAFRELWGGIGLVIVDRSHQFRPRDGTVSRGIRQDRYYDFNRLMRPLSDFGRIPIRARRYFAGHVTRKLPL